MHGVSFKYIALASCTGLLAHVLTPKDDMGFQFPETVGMTAILVTLWHVCLVNGAAAVLFNMRMGMGILGKDASTGAIPIWSFVLWPGFHLPTRFFTKISKLCDKQKGVTVADEVEPGWWVGGRYGVELGRRWAGTIDLTCEFPESCSATTDKYLLVRCWDGVPPTPEQLERAATFGVAARAHGDVMVHCAHGRGRSTTTMCACLVKAGLHPTWEAAFEAVRNKRKVCKLNRMMRNALTEWQNIYVAKQQPCDEEPKQK